MLKLQLVVSLLLSCASARYNILSLDGAKYKGYMTASFVEYMEQNAYTAARRDFCIPERESGKISMHELFDMIAGSETGAIIASSLVLPNTNATTSSIQKNEYFADTSKQWFKDHVDTMYHDTNIPILLNLFLTLLFSALFAAAAYFYVENRTAWDNYETCKCGLKDLVSLEKKKAKGQKPENIDKGL